MLSQPDRIRTQRKRHLNTPAHILLGAAAFGKRGSPRVLWAAMAGGIAPDVSLYLLVGTSLHLLDIPPRVVFRELYYSDAWQTVFAIDNSVFLWTALIAFALWRSMPALTAFASSGLLHIVLDFPLHAGDGRAHFWPVSWWIYDSPVSYWNSNFHAGYIIPISITLCLAALLLLLWRRHGLLPSALFSVLFAAELWTARQWWTFF